MTDTPLIPAPVYGLRTWRLAADERGELLTASCLETPWPADGAWLDATCARAGGHPAPDSECSCGVYAWHPRLSAARRVLAGRFEVPGVVEATGAIELQEDGFRAARARPYALVVTPGRNAARTARLARRYGAQVVEVPDARALVAWCAERGLGLQAPTVAALLGSQRGRERREAQRRRRRRDALRCATVAGVGAALLAAGAQFATGPPSPDGVYGRTGWVTRPKCMTETAPPAERGAPSRPPSDRKC